MGKFIDLTGERFGRLTVIRRGEDYVSPKGKHMVRWLCQCDCGNTCECDGVHLRSGHTQSCGCYSKERLAEARQSSHESNTYEISGEYAIGYTSNGEPFVIDAEDLDKAREVRWHKNSLGYLVGERNGRNYFLHRLIMDAPNDRVVDHINHQPEDNRKVNLRLVSLSENQMNQALTENSSSGHTGISWRPKEKKWVAYINSGRKQNYLGLFDSQEDAILARKAAESRLFGEYSYANSMALAEQNGYVLEPA